MDFFESVIASIVATILVGCVQFLYKDLKAASIYKKLEIAFVLNLLYGIGTLSYALSFENIAYKKVVLILCSSVCFFTVINGFLRVLRLLKDTKEQLRNQKSNERSENMPEK